MKLEWTKERPSELGWYWYRQDGGKPVKVCICRWVSWSYSEIILNPTTEEWSVAQIEPEQS